VSGCTMQDMYITHSQHPAPSRSLSPASLFECIYRVRVYVCVCVYIYIYIYLYIFKKQCTCVDMVVLRWPWSGFGSTHLLSRELTNERGKCIEVRWSHPPSPLIFQYRKKNKLRVKESWRVAHAMCLVGIFEYLNVQRETITV